MKISINLIKELRIKTGAGFLECKNSLIQSSGNIDMAIDILRKSGTHTALNKISNKTIDGYIFSYKINNLGVLLELNTETDFVVKTSEFKNFGQELVNFAGKNNINDVNILKKIFYKKRLTLISKIRENIIINRLEQLCGDFVITSVHMGKIGVLVSFVGKNFSQEQKYFMKNIALHIIAMNPLFLNKESIPSNFLEREKLIQTELAKKMGKPLFLLEKIIDGRMKKFINNITVLGQNFIIDSKKSVNQSLKENNIIISNFIRIKIGEK